MEEEKSTALTVIRENLPAPIESIRVSISPNSDPQKVRETLHNLRDSHVQVESASSWLKYLIGKTCVHVQSRKLYRQYGYRSFEKFLREEVYRPGLKRATVQDAIRAIRAWPDETPQRLGSIPSARLAIAAGIVSKAKLSRHEAAKLLRDAEKPDFEERASTSYAVIRIVTSKAFKREFTRWLGDRDAEEALREIIKPGKSQQHSAA